MERGYWLPGTPKGVTQEGKLMNRRANWGSPPRRLSPSKGTKWVLDLKKRGMERQGILKGSPPPRGGTEAFKFPHGINLGHQIDH